MTDTQYLEAILAEIKKLNNTINQIRKDLVIDKESNKKQING